MDDLLHIDGKLSGQLSRKNSNFNRVHRCCSAQHSTWSKMLVLRVRGFQEVYELYQYIQNDDRNPLEQGHLS